MDGKKKICGGGAASAAVSLPVAMPPPAWKGKGRHKAFTKKRKRAERVYLNELATSSSSDGENIVKFKYESNSASELCDQMARATQALRIV